jgi:type I restriction enzyme S subunit
LIAFEKDDILFGAMRPYFHRVHIAPLPGITRTTVFVLRARKDEYRAYALFYLYQNSSIDYANAHSIGSTIPYAIWKNGLETMPALIPDEEQISEFNNLVYPLIAEIRDSVFERRNLSKIRDLLLPKLVSGKIRVPVEAR